MREKVHVTWGRTPLSEMSADQIKYAKEKLREAWDAELPDEAVHRHAGLLPEEIEILKEKDPALAEFQIESVGSLNRKSRINISRSIKDEDDVSSSWKYLEKTDPQFQKKSDLPEGSKVIVTVAEREEALRQVIEAFDPGDISFDIDTPDSGAAGNEEGNEGE